MSQRIISNGILNNLLGCIVAGDAIKRRASFNVVHLATMFKADVFIFQQDSWSRELVT